MSVPVGDEPGGLARFACPPRFRQSESAPEANCLHVPETAESRLVVSAHLLGRDLWRFSPDEPTLEEFVYRPAELGPGKWSADLDEPLPLAFVEPLGDHASLAGRVGGGNVDGGTTQGILTPGGTMDPGARTLKTNDKRRRHALETVHPGDMLHISTTRNIGRGSNPEGGATPARTTLQFLQPMPRSEGLGSGDRRHSV